MLNRRFIVSCLVASIWIAPAVIAKEKSKLLANSSKSISFDNNELIVALLLRKDTPLSGSVIAYAKGDDIALPFEQLMFLLEFPIKSTNKGKQAKGWFIRKNNRFSLDLNAKKVISNGKSFQVNQSDLLIVKGELFVPSQLLSQWFPLDFKANLRSLDVIITPRQSIAIDERTTRKKKKFGVVYQVKSNLPERRTPYKAFSIPALELKFGVGYNSKSKSSLSSNYSIRSSSDLAFMHSDLFLAGSERKLTDARILLSRHDPRGRLLGRLDATIFEVGDISTRAIPLIRSNVTGRGLKIARHPLEYASGLEKITLEGSIELGYDLELYRNDILVDAIYSSQTTRYKFKDLKLFGGKNVFRLEFYGKQGQRRTKVKNYTAGAGQVRKGELLYNFAVYQANRSVFDIDKSLFNTGLLNNTSNSKKINIDASIDYGVNSNLTFTVGMSSRHEGNRSTTYGFSGIRTRLGRYFVNVDAATKNTGGSALGLAITTTVKKLDFSAKYEQYFSNFLAGAITEGSRNVNLKSLASIDVSSNSIKTGKNTYFNFGVGLNSSKLVNGNLSYSLDNRLGIRVSRANFTNSLSYSYSPQTKNKRLRGSSKLSFGFNRFGGGALRLGLDYEIKPKKQLRTANISISKRLASLYSTSLSYTEDFIDDSKKLSLSISKDFKPISLTLGAYRQTYEERERNNNGVFLTMSLNTFTDSKSLKTYAYNQNRKINSGVRAKVFLDDNNNGVFDANEKPVKGVKFSGFSNSLFSKVSETYANGSKPLLDNRKREETNKKGEVLLLGSSANAWRDVSLDTSTLPDASLRAGNNGYAILPRGGRITELNFPVIATGDIEGSVYLLKADGTKKPLGNIEIQAVRTNLFSGKQEVVAQVITSYDGFYSMAGVPLGDILLRIDPAQASRLAVVKGTTKKLNINKQIKFYNNKNFILVR